MIYIVLCPTTKNDGSIGYKVDLLISGLDFLQVDIGFALLAEVMINSYLNGKSMSVSNCAESILKM